MERFLLDLRLRLRFSVELGIRNTADLHVGGIPFSVNIIGNICILQIEILVSYIPLKNAARM